MNNKDFIAIICILILFLVLPATMQQVRADPIDPWFAQDKYIHFTGSAITSAVITGVTGCNRTVAVGITFALGAFKEFTDVRFSYKDLVWDIGGMLLGTLTIRC